MNLIIVESPTKASTISRFLGKDFKVESSYGHIRDLPKSKLGIDLENNFEPQYIIPVKAKKKVSLLKKEAEKAERVILATDEDREGEAIAFHLIEALGLNQKKIEIKRIVFHEITDKAIKQALKNSRDIDINMVNSQQARRILDRLVGYKLSPFLWKKIMSRLSAGRVQSAALKLIVERENEIKKFKTEEYWSIVATLFKIKNIETILYKINNETIPKLGIKTKEEAEKIVKDLEKCEFKILEIKTKELKKNPLPPFTTSTLQQEASKRLRFSAKQTMIFAQGLYENGLITYHRTDSLNMSKDALSATQKWIEKNLGKEYLLPSFRFFKTKSKLAQEAHEAIRPTRPDLTPEKLNEQVNIKLEKNGVRLYDLIWRRFIASQLPQACFNSTRVEIKAENPLNSTSYILYATGNILKFDGFLKIWPTQFEEKELPQLKENEDLKLIKVDSFQHFTEPPARYNEASLIKTLEEYGIGRPSTYAPIISVLQGRNYTEKDENRRFKPTEIGELVNKILTNHFPKIVDIQFTAEMEEKLDKIAEGKEEWQKIVGEFYWPFAENLEKKYEEVEKQKIEEKTEEICEKCNSPMIIKYGRFGKFLACSKFPECKNTKNINTSFKITDNEGNAMRCPQCPEGIIVRKKTKKGRFFYGCDKYPACKYASWSNPKIDPISK
ncbi:MAG: type I DNA topoisomerase [Candidatus Liptonbacteria bacterium]|nr:type I DNA topoisomerase [Candidatus Liptonbacteria bacterium]